MRSALEHVLAKLRERIPTRDAFRLTVSDLIAMRDAVARQKRRSGMSLEDIRRLAISRVVQLLGQDDPDLARSLADLYFTHRFGDMQLYPDVLPALQALRSRHILGMATNGNSDPERSELAGYFDFSLFADRCGVEKPAPAFYRLLVEQAKVPAENILHVGDSLANDVHGAEQAGIRAVWLNRDNRSHQPYVQPQLRISSLLELPSLLDELHALNAMEPV